MYSCLTRLIIEKVIPHSHRLFSIEDDSTSKITSEGTDNTADIQAAPKLDKLVDTFNEVLPNTLVLSPKDKGKMYITRIVLEAQY